MNMEINEAHEAEEPVSSEDSGEKRKIVVPGEVIISG